MTAGTSFGFVETLGLVAAVEAADAMAKAAAVRIKTIANADAALICVVCEGGLGACIAAVEAGRAAAARVGDCLRSNVIARPFEDTEELTGRRIGALARPDPAPEIEGKEAPRRDKRRKKKS